MKAPLPTEKEEASVQNPKKNYGRFSKMFNKMY